MLSEELFNTKISKCCNALVNEGVHYDGEKYSRCDTCTECGELCEFWQNIGVHYFLGRN